MSLRFQPKVAGLEDGIDGFAAQGALVSSHVLPFEAKGRLFCATYLPRCTHSPTLAPILAVLLPYASSLLIDSSIFHFSLGASFGVLVFI